LLFFFAVFSGGTFKGAVRLFGFVGTSLTSGSVGVAGVTSGCLISGFLISGCLTSGSVGVAGVTSGCFCKRNRSAVALFLA
jgi:hypothetical protein